MTGSGHGRRAARRVAGAAVAGGLTLAVACAAPAGVTHASRPAVHSASRSAASTMALTDLAEFSKPTAAQYTLPSVNVQDYKICYQGALNPSPPEAWQSIAAEADGYANAEKQQQSLPAGYPAPGLIVSSQGGGFKITELLPASNGHDYSCTLAEVQLDDNGLRQLPPMRATFLSFGFMPVTATVTLTQSGSAPMTAVIYQDRGIPTTAGSRDNSGAPFTVVATASLELHLSDVLVDGTTLNVGSSCRTSGVLTTPGNPVSPGELMLVGGSETGDPQPGYTSVQTGGALATLARIPPFTGCVTPAGENVDALLDASVSGSGNYVQVDQGPACTSGPFQCVGSLPKFTIPLTVTDGGNYASTGSFLLSPTPSGLSATISCSDSSVSGQFPDATGPGRGSLASANWSAFTGCTGSDGSTWQITQPEPAYFSANLYRPAQGYAQGTIADVTFDLSGQATGASGTCHAVMSGYVPTNYTNATSAFEIGAQVGPNMIISNSDCPDLPDTTVADNYITYEPSATYTMAPGGTMITSP